MRPGADSCPYCGTPKRMGNRLILASMKIDEAEEAAQDAVGSSADEYTRGVVEGMKILGAVIGLQE